MVTTASTPWYSYLCCIVPCLPLLFFGGAVVWDTLFPPYHSHFPASSYTRMSAKALREEEQDAEEFLDMMFDEDSDRS